MQCCFFPESNSSSQATFYEIWEDVLLHVNVKCIFYTFHIYMLENLHVQLFEQTTVLVREMYFLVLEPNLEKIILYTVGIKSQTSIRILFVDVHVV